MRMRSANSRNWKWGAVALIGLAIGACNVDTFSPLSGEPRYTTYSEPPEILNRGEIQAALLREYPSLLRDAGVGGTTSLSFYIRANGVVQDVLVAETSGHQQLDRAALRIARTFRFRPARRNGVPIRVWIPIPITFMAS